MTSCADTAARSFSAAVRASDNACYSVTNPSRWWFEGVHQYDVTAMKLSHLDGVVRGCQRLCRGVHARHDQRCTRCRRLLDHSLFNLDRCRQVLFGSAAGCQLRCIRNLDAIKGRSRNCDDRT